MTQSLNSEKSINVGKMVTILQLEPNENLNDNRAIAWFRDRDPRLERSFVIVGDSKHICSKVVENNDFKVGLRKLSFQKDIQRLLGKKAADEVIYLSKEGKKYILREGELIFIKIKKKKEKLKAKSKFSQNSSNKAALN